jgi:transposase InsO family protein
MSKGVPQRVGRSAKSSAASSASSLARFITCFHPPRRQPPVPHPVDIYRSFNALAKSVNGLFKAELIRRRGPWRTADDVELATLEWVDWWNKRRLHSACGDIPPAEFETLYYTEQATVPAA